MADKKEIREVEKVVRDLDILLQDLISMSLQARTSPDAKLEILEAMMASTRGSRSWAAWIERAIWRMSAPLWDFRLRRQIRLVAELGKTIGWQTKATADAIHRLDDLVFARTYGAMVAPQIKRAIRDLANRGVMATHELQSLILNGCLRVDNHGVVVVPRQPWLRPIGIVALILVSLGVLQSAALVAFAPLSILATFIGLTIYSGVFGIGFWLVDRFSFAPHRLIPRARNALRRPSLV